MENDDSIISSSPTNDKFLNELTMKFLTNKTCYEKYLLKTDSVKFEEQQQFIKDCAKYNSKIISITDDLCNDSNNNYGTDVKEAFDNYARIIIRYLEVKEKSDEIQKEYTDEENEMFPYSMNEIPSINPKHGSMDMFVKKL